MPVTGLRVVLTENAVINCRLICTALQQNSIIYNEESWLDVHSDGPSILLKIKVCVVSVQ